MPRPSFETRFRELTNHAPFPWQQALYDLLVVGKPPTTCDIPTGLGKTAIIPIWLLALAEAPTLVPRRLVYVVNRRTVVDQATVEALNLVKRLTENQELNELRKSLTDLCAFQHDFPLAISTLRGELADNSEWRSDPARPAIIVGTVDMIGSRLLFSGYGCGYKTRPLHAGFLGQDVLLVHDEAHLEPAFQELLNKIEEEQQRCQDFAPIKVMELTATPRSKAPFQLTPPELAGEVPDVAKRLNAKKSLRLHPAADEKTIVDKVVEFALSHKDSGLAILIYMRTVEDVKKVADKLGKVKKTTLTGTMRGKERDDLVKTSIFKRFTRASGGEPGTVYLVSTSAGEVGVNISADHLICDLTPYDSMAQRFGRVNRFGDCPDTSIDVVHPDPAKFDETKPLDAQRRKTLDLLRSLNGNASPKALGELPQKERLAAFSPQPVKLPATDILFDAWALTTIRDHLPGRPPVTDYLHGVPDDWQPPETQVAWREEVELLKESGLTDKELDELLEAYPLKPQELLKDRSDRVAKQLAIIAARHPEQLVWLIDDGVFATVKLSELTNFKGRIEHCRVVLPTFVGGLTDGMLDGAAKDEVQDVGDQLFDRDRQQRRKRVTADVLDDERDLAGFRLAKAIPLRIANDEDEDSDGETGDDSSPLTRFFLVRPKSADDEDAQSVTTKQTLEYHVRKVTIAARLIADKLGIDDRLGLAIVRAAELHDTGKDRRVWQRGIGNFDNAELLAKSVGRRASRLTTSFRHEFGSLVDAQRANEVSALQGLDDDMRELVLHLIAAHHGRGRPHFPSDEAFDPEPKGVDANRVAAEVPRRFARLQRKYGRWGLAYLESLLRAADYAASAKPTSFADEPEAQP